MPSTLVFPPFRIDSVQGELWHGAERVAIRPKTRAVLHFLIEHRDRVVTRDELRDAVWPKSHGSEHAPKQCILELRALFGDTADAPRFIESVGRQGYRFIAQPAAGAKQAASYLVGREAQLGELDTLLGKALRGERQIVFVTGEAGIGKSALVEAFLARIANEQALWVGQGQSVEHYGAGEAYLPVLEALARLCRSPGGERAIETLRQHAPSWLMQMPTLLEAAPLAALQRDAQGVTHGRMLRELADGLEALSAGQPVVLVLEDLHWSDASTVELLAMLARRRETARLMVLATFRPVELIVTDHPLKTAKHELIARGEAVEISLGHLGSEAVRSFVALRFGDRIDDDVLADFVYRRTDGHPLFMVHVAQHLAQHGAPAGAFSAQANGDMNGQLGVEQMVPAGLRELIEAQFSRLQEGERQLLQAASVAGAEFAVASVAAGLQIAIDAAEVGCEELARREQFIEERGLIEWPDGTVSGRYGFRHALYQEALYQQQSPTRRGRLHRRIGLRLEAGYRERAPEIATELAMHFEQVSDVPRAVRYREQAARNALWRSAQREAIEHLRQGLALLQTLADSKERAEQEFALQMALGGTLMTVKGWAAPEAGSAFSRAGDLARQIGETSRLFRSLSGLSGFHLARAELQKALEIAEQMLALAERNERADFIVRTGAQLGMTLFYLGRLPLAQKHLEHGIANYDPQKHHPLIAGGVTQDPKVMARCYLALTLWLRGYPERALECMTETLTFARALAHPFSLAWAFGSAAQLDLLSGESEAAERQAEALLALADEQGFPKWGASGGILRAFARAEQGRGQEDILRVQRGLRRSRPAEEQRIELSFYLGLLARAQGKAGRAGEGLADLGVALAAVDATGERWYEAELHRLKGELTLQQANAIGAASEAQTFVVAAAAQSQAEGSFREAIEIARLQQAKSLELCASVSLARLWQQQGRKTDAERLLGDVYNWFGEGFGTKDLREAQTLLRLVAVE